MLIFSRLFVLLSLLFLATAGKLFAQTTWTGNVSAVWTNAANWTSGVPTALVEAIIPDVTNDPVIGDATAAARSVTLQPGSVLTIDSGARLTLNGSTVQALFNEGTVHNNGTVTIGNTYTVGSSGLVNRSIFNNNAGAILNIDRVAGKESAAIRSADTGELRNHGTVNIGKNTTAGAIGIASAGILINFATGKIYIDRVTTAAISYIEIDNSGEIAIGSIAAGNTMELGLDVFQKVTNNTGGRISFDHVKVAVQFRQRNDMINEGTVTIGKTTTVPDLIKITNGTIVPGQLHNHAGGVFEATGNLDLAYQDLGGTTCPGAAEGVAGWLNFYSRAKEHLDTGILKMDVNGAGAAGIAYDQIRVAASAVLGGTLALAVNYTPTAGDRITLLKAAAVTGTFATVTGLPAGWNLAYTSTEVILSYGELAQTTWTGNIDADWHKAGNWSNGVPGDRSEVSIPDATNDPVISAGNASALTLTVQTGAVLTVNASRSLTIDESYGNGLINKGTVHNSGDIVIGVAGDINLTAVLNEGTFNNNAEAKILINRAAPFGPALSNPAGIFNNAGMIRIGADAGAAQYGVHNTGVFTNLPTGSIHVDRTTEAAMYNGENVNFNNQGTIVIGAAAAAGVNGIANYGSFTNQEGGRIQIDRVSNAAIYHVGTIVRNTGDITIGALAGGNTMVYGIYAEQQITHHIGTIRIDRVNTAIALNAGNSVSSSNIIVGELGNVPVMLSGAYNGIIYNENGLFKGSGSIDGYRFLNTRGTIDPGTPIGKMTFLGNLTLNANSVIPMQITGAGAAGVDYDQFEVTGTAALGGRLDLSITYSPQAGDRITIVKAGTLSGTFSTITPLPIGWELLYENNSMVLHYYATGSTTWTGAVNTNWHTPANWTSNVPAEGVVAIIPDVTNDPVISTTTAVAGAVFVSAGGLLTINGAAVLTLDEAYSPGIHNYGTVQNDGTITIGSTSASYFGINNAGSFHNNAGAKIDIDRTTNAGIVNSAGSFYNTGTVNIGGNAAAGINGLDNAADFDNLAQGKLNIDRVSFAGINHTNSAFRNSGIINIGAKTGGTTSSYGFYVGRSADNLEQGVINIDRTGTGVFVAVSVGFYNSGKMVIGGSGSVPMLVNGSLVAQFYNSRGSEFHGSGAVDAGHFDADYSKIFPGSAARGQISFNRSKDFRDAEMVMNINGAGTAGTDYDQITVAGTATLGGNLTLIMDYAGSEGDQIPVLTATSIAGKFATITGLAKNWTIVYSATTVSLVYTPQTLWTGAVNADWNNSGNWTAGVPTADANAVIEKVTTNAPVINTANAIAKSVTIESGGVLTIDAAGVFTLNGSPTQALLNHGSVENHGTIHIGSISAVGVSGIRNEATFNNHTGGKINIDRSTSTVILNVSGVFSNSGELRIGANAASGSDGINNAGTFHNSVGGQIFIDRTTSVGIFHEGIDFTNEGIVTIGALPAGNTINYGIYINQNFNNAGGEIHIDRVNKAIAAANGTLTNAGLVNVGASTNVPALIAADGNGTFTNNTGGEIEGKNTIAAARFVHSGGKLSPGNSPGTLTFDASENFSNGIVNIEVNGTGAPGVNFDQITVNGTATLGGTLNVSLGYTWARDDKITILSAEGISGTFSTITGVPPHWKVDYTSNAVTLTAIAPLPVTLVAFNVRAAGNTAELQWRTSSETDNKGFFIERSTDAARWSEIGFIDGNATTAQHHDYVFYDENPVNGMNYYRLRQIDFDGKTEHSRIAGLRFDKSGDEITVWVDANRKARVRTDDTVEVVTIFDLSGRLLTASDQMSVDLSKVPAGILLVRVQTNRRTVTKKVILH